MAQNPPAQMVVLGPIITMDPANPRATGLVIRDGLISEVTNEETARQRIGPDTVVLHVPAKGACTPGIIESHAHLLGVGRSMRTLDLRSCRSAAEVATRVSDALKDMEANSWLLGRGWNQELWDHKVFPTKEILDAVSPNNGVVLTRVDGHALWANSFALAQAKVSSATPSPSGGEILKDAGGQVTGILIDNAMDLVTVAVPTSSGSQETSKDYLAAQEEALSLGITTFVDAGTSPKELLVLNKLYSTGEMQLRVYAMLSVNGPEDLQKIAGRPPIPSLHNGRVTVRAWKLYADGALGSRGAWLLKPYADRAGHLGLPVLDPSFIERAADQALRQGYQVCVHAIGDRGVRETLNAMERALARHPGGRRCDHRFRIEHSQIVSPEDVPRFSFLGVIPSMQGCHCTSDGPWVPDRLGPQRAAEEAYVWRSFLDAGCIIPNGTDAPVESLSPWRNFYSTITRFMATPNGPIAFEPGQRMSRTEALASLTTWGAMGIFQEDHRGMLRPGMVADLAVLNRDPLKASVWHVGRTGVLYTVIDGTVCYAKN